MSLTPQKPKNGLAAAALVWAMVATMAAVGGIIVADHALDEAKKASSVTAGEEVTVSLKEFSITPAPINVAEESVLKVVNDGTIEHNLAIDDESKETPLLGAGKTGTLALSGLDKGSYTIRCTVPGHADSGMKTQLNIGERGAVAAPAAMTPEEMDAAAKERTGTYPAKTAGDGESMLEPTILPDGTKQFELTAKVVQWEVEPGRVVEAWGYNGVVPGPTIRASSGDKVRIRVKNELHESTTVHWHGIDVPNAMDGVPDITQEQIKQGETFDYEFDAIGPAVGMYHAHSNSQLQVPKGLFGPFIIDSLPLPAGVKVTQEKSWVLNDAGDLGFTINGKAFPATYPVVVKQGETILLHYFNEGLQIHPMHLHGPRQTVIAKDGAPLTVPYQADTILVGPGERYSVLVTPDRPGTWVWHCHILTHAEAPNGFIGMTSAMVVQ